MPGRWVSRRSAGAAQRQQPASAKVRLAFGCQVCSRRAALFAAEEGRLLQRVPHFCRSAFKPGGWPEG